VDHGTRESSHDSLDGSIEKWLVLDGMPDQRWRLADDTNLDILEAHIKAAMHSGEALSIEVESDCAPFQTRLVLNGRALAFVVLCEIRR
jgi:hypothetical protein